jgi:hypothetical protein
MKPLLFPRKVFLACVTAALLAAAAPARADGPLPNCYVLAVGVDKHKEGTKLNNLNGCRNDASNLAARLSEQAGKIFAKVAAPEVLHDAQATGGAVRAAMDRLRGQGKAGDWYVLVLSGHGGTNGNAWSFLPHDADPVTDRFILGWADALAAQGKKAWIIIDACQSGQLRVNARELLARYQDPNGGGVLLMVASVPTQCSVALGQFSSFAQAVNEALQGEADFDGDGVVTLREIRHYAYSRPYELILQFSKNGSPHDSVCEGSLSLSGNQKLAVSRVKTVLRVNANLTDKDAKDSARKTSFCKTYPVNLRQGVTYTIDLKSTGFDTYLRVEDDKGQPVAVNDDLGHRNRNSQVVLPATRTGAYRVVVTSYTEGATGPFTLTVKYRP